MGYQVEEGSEMMRSERKMRKRMSKGGGGEEEGGGGGGRGGGGEMLEMRGDRSRRHDQRHGF
eukprot:749234-Hanusia_phi.AAC.4